MCFRMEAEDYLLVDSLPLSEPPASSQPSQSAAVVAGSTKPEVEAQCGSNMVYVDPRKIDEGKAV